MKKKYGIPYMGSKSDIIASLAMNFPSADNFYDLFGGGFSVSHYMIKHKSHRYKMFHYNEIVPSTVDLVKRAISGDFSYDKFKPEWISREEFFKRKDNDAYVRLCWSFGNNQNGYLFGSDIEAYKKSMHNAIVFDEFDDVAKKVLGFSSWPSEVSSIKSRRYFLSQKVRYNLRGNNNKFQQMEHLERIERLQLMEHLERIERLQQLEELNSFSNLTITSLDYRDVEITPNSVVYCDIPYKGTASYLNKFNHADFFDWAATRNFPVFISEYEIEEPRFQLVYAVGKTVKINSKGSTKENADMNREKLYWNKK